jgi:thiol:disulfide interchange protein
MKKTAIFILLMTLWVTVGFKDAGGGKGIQFFKGTMAEALTKAKEQQKPIFIDVYATWCGPCKELKRSTFKDKEVGEYFNKNFINIAVDGDTKEGIKVLQDYDVRSYPTLLIIDSGAKQLAKAEGFMKPHILVNFGRRVVP